MGIPRATLDTIRQSADLIGLFRSGGTEVKREGKRFKACCPFHDDRTPSLSIDPERGTYYCFACGQKGDALDYVQRTEHLSFPEAARSLATRLGLGGLPGIEAQEAPPVPRPLEVLELAQQHFARCLGAGSADGERARGYLTERGVLLDIAERYGLGFAPALWAGLTTALKRKGVSDAELLDVGLVAERRRNANHKRDTSRKRDPNRSGGRGVYDVFRGRITFPFRDGHGRVVGFGGRTVSAFETRGRSKPHKYINSPETPVFSKGNLLFGLHEARASIREERTVVVVEGYLDVLALARIGIGAVATAGTAFSEAQAGLLARHGAERALFVFDGDDGGVRATTKAVEAGLVAGITPYVVLLDQGTDPAELVAAEEAAVVRALLRNGVTSGVRFLAGQADIMPEDMSRKRFIAGGVSVGDGLSTNAGGVTEVEDVLERARRFCEIIARVGDGLRRAALAREAAHVLELPVAAVYDRVEEMRASV